MKCPVCTCRLRRIKSRGLEFDVCTNCAGVWFDSGELQLFLRDLVNSDHVTPEQTRLFQPREVERVDQSTLEIKACPKCGMVLKTFNYAYDSNIFVDKCPQCEGIWTDAGEAKRLARYIKTDPQILTVGHDICKRERYFNHLKEQAEAAQAMKRGWRFTSPMPRIIIPLGDDLENEKFPLVTVSVIVLCAAIFLFQFFGVSDNGTIAQQYGFVPNDFFSIGLFASIFLHAGVFHIAGNMLFLWIFGDNVEDRFGRWQYALFYITSGVAANIVYAIFHMNSNIPCVGASGAISGDGGVRYLLSGGTIEDACRLLSCSHFSGGLSNRMVFVPTGLQRPVAFLWGCRCCVAGPRRRFCIWDGYRVSGQDL